MKQKRLIIGDIHGHWENFRDIYYKENPDEVIILGDYFDNFHGTDQSIIDCFDNILTLREVHLKEKRGGFYMLMGNHDYHYLNVGSGERYSGWRQSMAQVAYVKLTECIENGTIQVAYVDTVNKSIYTHAGLTNTWMRTNNLYDIQPQYLNECLNKINLIHLRWVGSDFYGNDPKNGPLWVRPDALLFDTFEDQEGYTWTQIVGHTNLGHPIIIKADGKQCNSVKESKEYHCNTNGSSEENIIYVMDCMPKYYMVETYDFKTEKIIDRKIVSNNLNN